MKIHVYFIGFVIAFNLFSFKAEAQIVNVQGLLSEKPQKGIKFGLSGSGYIASGNVNYQKFAGVFVTRGFKDPHIFIFTSSAEYSEKDDVPFWERYFEHFRYRLGLNKYFGLETFLQHEYNKFKRFSKRFLYGAGTYFKYEFSFKLRFILGTDYMFEYNEYSEDPNYTDSGAINKFHRLDTYLTIEYPVSENISVTSTTYYQPEFKDFENYLLFNEVSFLMKINKWLKFNVTYSNAYNNRPPEGVEKHDTRFLIGLNVAAGPF